MRREEINLDSEDLFEGLEVDTEEATGGPDTAELIATRSELKRIETENADLKDRFQRRQADFENYRKRVERERSETYNRVVADIAGKLAAGDGQSKTCARKLRLRLKRRSQTSFAIFLVAWILFQNNSTACSMR